MVFQPEEKYKVTFDDGEVIYFTVPGNETIFHRKVALLDSGKEIFLYALLLKDWLKIEVVHH